MFFKISLLLKRDDYIKVYISINIYESRLAIQKTDKIGNNENKTA